MALNSHEDYGLLREGAMNAPFGFALAFRFREPYDLARVAETLKEGIVICSTKYIAGKEHAKRILFQASEYWKLDKRLARNKSIDLLMRITCQSQISRALALAEVSRAKEVALFGIAEDAEEADKAGSKLFALGAIRNDSLLNLTHEKGMFLRKFHGLPMSCSPSQLVDFLEEKAVLLVFSR